LGFRVSCPSLACLISGLVQGLYLYLQQDRAGFRSGFSLDTSRLGFSLGTSSTAAAHQGARGSSSLGLAPISDLG